jgi:hypothetical protein
MQMVGEEVSGGQASSRQFDWQYFPHEDEWEILQRWLNQTGQQMNYARPKQEIDLTALVLVLEGAIQVKQASYLNGTQYHLR